MASPPPAPWIAQALRAHAAESPRWQYVFGLYEARDLGGTVLDRRFGALRDAGFEQVGDAPAGLLVGRPADLPRRMDRRTGIARAALAGGLAAWRRLNTTTALHRQLALLIPAAPHRIVPLRFGPPEAVAEHLADLEGPVRLLTSRFDEVLAYRRAGLEVLGQEGVAQAYTVWLLGQPSSLPTRRA